MTYKDAIIHGMTELAKNPKFICLGYNLKYGHRLYGTLSGVPSIQIQEMPIAEALISGVSLGLSISGFRPMMCIERHDFLTLTMDNILNHMNLINKLSNGEYNSNVIIRAIIGGTKPFYPGLQHTKDFTSMMKLFTEFKVFEMKTIADVQAGYEYCLQNNENIFLSEHRDLYNME